jgi:hypothetical protein
MGLVPGKEARQGKDFFFEKKKQKAFDRLSRTQRRKVFWSFFSKKDRLLSS